MDTAGECDDDERARTLIARLAAQGTFRRVDFDGGSVAWRRFGTGPPFVLLHGGHGSWLHWGRNNETLASRFTVWVPDLPGYGDSDVPKAPTLAALVEATVSTLDAVVGAGTPIDLAGFSFGGLGPVNTTGMTA